MREANNIVRRY